MIKTKTPISDYYQQKSIKAEKEKKQSKIETSSSVIRIIKSKAKTS